MRSYAIVAVLALLAITHVSAVRIKDCGSMAVVDYTNIQITGCKPRAPYCIFRKNTTAHISIPFTPKTEITSLKAVVYGIIAGIPLPFPLDNPEACQVSFPCPAEAGKRVLYTEGLPVKALYPSLRLTVEWSLEDQAGNKQVCLRIPVKLQS
uniref:Protein NPC2 homolog n=2 Tax=Hirondellea gigas TaxID=1518452 RepID=A0A6A7FUZ6_9CRUS